MDPNLFLATAVDAAPSVLGAFAQALLSELGVRHDLGDAAVLFGIAVARWLPVAVLVPFIGSRGVPGPVKMAVATILALGLVPWLSWTYETPLTLDTVAWWGLLVRETAVGLILALVGGLVFWGAEMAGRWLDLVRGQTLANLMVPEMQTQSSQLGAFYYQLLLVLYLGVGGHRFFFDAMFRSYELLPPSEAGLGLPILALGFLEATSQLFVLAVRLVAPGVLVVIFLDLMLGVANRMAPQLDVFFLGLSLKSTLALLAIALSAYMVEPIATEAFQDQQQQLEWFLNALPE